MELPWDVIEEYSDTAAEVTEDSQETATDVIEFSPGPRSADNIT